MDLQVPPVKMEGGPKAPFQAVCLQQAWQEDGSALSACVRPTDESPTQHLMLIKERLRKIKVRSI